MTAALSPRGPDGQGVYVDAARGLAVGHARLAVQDLTPAAAQPMHPPDPGRRAMTLSYNGEIYNHMALRRDLEHQGFAWPWRSSGDTETLCCALAAWGPAATLPRLHGMFAFAWWDGATLTLARDRLGEKPMTYGFCAGAFLFGSTVAALEAHPRFPTARPGQTASLDRHALAAYFAWGCTPAPACIYKNCWKLPPGAMLAVQAKHVRRGEPPPPEQWFRVSDVALASLADPFPADLETAAAALGQAVEEAVAERLLSDAPLGAFLSGGVDSALVAACAHKAAGGGLALFTMGSPDPQYDETERAAAVAQALGAPHVRLPVTEQDALALAPTMGCIYDEPFADSSQLPTALLCKMAREHVTVCLSGDGGDELFGGYNRHVLGPAIWRVVSHAPPGLRRLLALALRRGGEAGLAAVVRGLAPLLAPSRRQTLVRDKLAKVRRGLEASDRETFYQALATLWSVPPLVDARAKQTYPRWPEPSRVAGLERLAFRDWMQAADQLGYLPDDILTKVDRASMAVGLEVRAVFLDHRLLAQAWRLPPTLRAAGGVGKPLLRRLLEQRLPQPLPPGPKQGFGAPMPAWLRGPLAPWVDTLLSPEKLQRDGLLDVNAVRAARVRLQHGPADVVTAARVWAVCMFQNWLEARA